MFDFKLITTQNKEFMYVPEIHLSKFFWCNYNEIWVIHMECALQTAYKYLNSCHYMHLTCLGTCPDIVNIKLAKQ